MDNLGALTYVLINTLSGLYIMAQNIPSDISQAWNNRNRLMCEKMSVEDLQSRGLIQTPQGATIKPLSTLYPQQTGKFDDLELTRKDLNTTSTFFLISHGTSRALVVINAANCQLQEEMIRLPSK